jgi:uncharacterized protein with PIN domain
MVGTIPLRLSIVDQLLHLVFHERRWSRCPACIWLVVKVVSQSAVQHIPDFKDGCISSAYHCVKSSNAWHIQQWRYGSMARNAVGVNDKQTTKLRVDVVGVKELN